MSNQLTKELQEAIAKNMPHMVGEELNKVLAQGAYDAELVVKLKSELTDTKTQLSTSDKGNERLRDEVNELQIKLKEAGDVEKRERDLKVTLAEKDTESAKSLAKQAFDMVTLVFRNPTVMRSTMTTTPVSQHYSQPGGGGHSTVSNFSGNETIHEETK